MATQIKEGDRVQIVDRPLTAEDVKNNLYYNHFRGLTGIVQKMYATNEVAIEIELDVLPEAVAGRHLDIQEAMKTKWLEGLSEEGRNRLTDQERDFRLRYTVLVAAADLVAPISAPVAPKPPAKTTTQTRVTEHDLAAAEDAELKRRQQE